MLNIRFNNMKTKSKEPNQDQLLRKAVENQEEIIRELRQVKDQLKRLNENL